jgi:predicted MFS family arabinose efflux permease
LVGVSIGLCLALVLIFLPKFGIPAFILLYLCIGADEIILSDMLNRFIPSENRATVLSAQNQLNSLSYTCVAVLLGKAMDSLGIQVSALITGFLLMIGFSILFLHNNFKEHISTNSDSLP